MMIKKPIKRVTAYNVSRDCVPLVEHDEPFNHHRLLAIVIKRNEVGGNLHPLGEGWRLSVPLIKLPPEDWWAR